MNNSKLWLIIQREYLNFVAKKSFIVMTIITPFIILLVGAAPALLALINKGDNETIAVIDETRKFESAFENTEEFTFELVKERKSNPHDILNERKDHLSAIIIIPQNVETTSQVLVYSQSSVSMSLKSHISRCMEKVLTDAKINSYNIEGLSEILAECDVEVDVRNITWSEDGNEQISSTDIAMILGISLSLLSYFFVLAYGSMIMNSVIEEKTNRIVEVIVSSCKPFELMLGKIIGIALVGLTQVAIWVALLSVISAIVGVSLVGNPMTEAQTIMASTGDSSALPEMDFLATLLSINYVQIITFFIIYFIGGFLLYASIFAALGSAVDQASDASQFTSPVLFVIIIALYAALACMENPDGNIAFWCSLIPFTSPMVMMIRLPFNVPTWEMITSIAVLYASAAAMTALAAKIYRTGILRYGKKPSYKDLIKWLK